MPNPDHMIPYNEWKPKLDLVLTEVQEVSAQILRLRDHDFGSEIKGMVKCNPVLVNCFGVVPDPPPQAPCVGISGNFTIAEALGAIEKLTGSIREAIRDLRLTMEPESPPDGP